MHYLLGGKLCLATLVEKQGNIEIDHGHILGTVVFDGEERVVYDFIEEGESHVFPEGKTKMADGVTYVKEINEHFPKRWGCFISSKAKLIELATALNAGENGMMMSIRIPQKRGPVKTKKAI